MSPRRFLTVVAAAALLAACEQIPFRPAPAAQAPAPPRPAVAPAAGQAAVPAVQPPAAPEALPKIEGMRQEEIIARLGPPAAERDVAPAKVLDYKATGCEMAIYLYFDTGRAGFFALHYDVNGRPAPSRDADRCLRLIAAAKRG